MRLVPADLVLTPHRPRQYVSNFEQTPAAGRDRFAASQIVPERIVPTPKNPGFKDYARYAMYCLEMVPISEDQDIGALNREMAVEWIRLAEAALHLVKRKNDLGRPVTRP